MCGPCGNAACINGRQFYLKGRLVAVNHLYDIQEELYEKGKRPGNIAGGELLKAVGYPNYIPEGLEDEYQDVLMREFESFARRKR
jgi:hypothetical protein